MFFILIFCQSIFYTYMVSSKNSIWAKSKGFFPIHPKNLKSGSFNAVILWAGIQTFFIILSDPQGGFFGLFLKIFQKREAFFYFFQKSVLQTILKKIENFLGFGTERSSPHIKNNENKPSGGVKKRGWNFGPKFFSPNLKIQKKIQHHSNKCQRVCKRQGNEFQKISHGKGPKSGREPCSFFHQFC